MSADENREMKKNEIVLFETQDNEIKLEVPIEQETVWLTANSMAELFGRDEKTIRKHINNVFSEKEVDRENNRCHSILWMSLSP